MVGDPKLMAESHFAIVFPSQNSLEVKLSNEVEIKESTA